MSNSLSNLVNTLAEGIHRIKCILGHYDTNRETGGIKYKYGDCFFEYTNFKDDLIEQKCLLWNKNCQENFEEKLKKLFFNTYKFSNHDNNKLILLLQKVVYPY